MNTQEVMTALEAMGDPQTKKTHARHGAKEPFFGVKVGELKKLVKKIKKDYHLSLDLYKTGNSDAMYLAGLIADEKQMTPQDLQSWVEGAYWSNIAEYTVSWIASESNHGWEMAQKWITADEEHIQAAGWSTLASLLSITPDEDIDHEQYSKLLDHVEKHIHQSKNRVRYTMNQFVIACGCFTAHLKEKAESVAANIGKVSVNMGGTACKVPLATDYIKKVEKMGRVGRKKKMARC